MSKKIIIRGARTHNLQNIDVDIPRDKLVVVTGPSGSGKSSLTFDTLYAEGQRRYVESLSSYARQFLSMMEKPDVDSIEGLSPAISIDQKATSHNPRSTVGTVTEIYDYLRLLYARVGRPRCPDHSIVLEAQTISQMVDQVLSYPEGAKLMLLAPIVQNRKGEYSSLLEKLRSQGFIRVRIDGDMFELDEIPELDINKKHDIEVVVDRFKVRPEIKQRLAESFETSIRIANGLAIIAPYQEEGVERLLSANFSCPECGYSLGELQPKLFSFNNPTGACPTCDGLGSRQIFDAEKILQDENQSIADGAIRGWDKKHGYYFSLIRAVCKHFGVDVDIPYKKLPDEVKAAIFYGTDFPIEMPQVGATGEYLKRERKFLGIIEHLERRYRDTDSPSRQDDLARFITQVACSDCGGARLNRAARNVLIQGHSLPELCSHSIKNLFELIDKFDLSGKRAEIANKIFQEVKSRLSFLIDVGLDYLSLNRNADTLSGGEAQRIRLASQIGSGLVGVMYVLDEPTIGLHQRDNERLIKTLLHLRDLGNSVIVVEHDEDTMLAADHILDIGPMAGVHGGKLVSQGDINHIKKDKNSITGQYLSGKQKIDVPKSRVAFNPKHKLVLRGARCNNLKNIDVQIPLGLLVCVTGVSGSGKSSLINDTLCPATTQLIQQTSRQRPGEHDALDGLEYIDKVIAIDQSPIGRTPRSNPATYTGLFTPIRELFAATNEARSRGYKAGRFSFNVKGGRCESCQGEGVIKVEMHFLADVYVTCEICQGTRYNRETLEITYKGKTIHEVLEMTIEEAREFFDPVPTIARKLQTLIDVGLSYLCLGQAAPTLSGGEAQRVKLSRELSRRGTGQTMYILDEPTTGLHFNDVKQLLEVLHRLRDQGNTLIVIEHNLDVIKTADWLIDMGPEGGDGGGQVVAEGTPETVSKNKKSYTGRYLLPVLTKS